MRAPRALYCGFCCMSQGGSERSRSLNSLNRFGWEWVSGKSLSANWLDLAYLLSRNSKALDGHMGCVIVKDTVLVESVNHGLFDEFRSDVHAEASAICDAARRGISLEGSTLYVTRAPCQRCYRLIAQSGITKIVAPNAMEAKEQRNAQQRGLEYEVLRDDDERRSWRDQKAAPFRDDDAILAQRALRKARKAQFRGRLPPPPSEEEEEEQKMLL